MAEANSGASPITGAFGDSLDSHDPTIPTLFTTSQPIFPPPLSIRRRCFAERRAFSHSLGDATSGGPHLSCSPTVSDSPLPHCGCLTSFESCESSHPSAPPAMSQPRPHTHHHSRHCPHLLQPFHQSPLLAFYGHPSLPYSPRHHQCSNPQLHRRCAHHMRPQTAAVGCSPLAMPLRPVQRRTPCLALLADAGHFSTSLCSTHSPPLQATAVLHDAETPRRRRHRSRGRRQRKSRRNGAAVAALPAHLMPRSLQSSPSSSVGGSHGPDCPALSNSAAVQRWVNDAPATSGPNLPKYNSIEHLPQRLQARDCAHIRRAFYSKSRSEDLLRSHRGVARHLVAPPPTTVARPVAPRPSLVRHAAVVAYDDDADNEAEDEEREKKQRSSVCADAKTRSRSVGPMDALGPTFLAVPDCRPPIDFEPDPRPEPPLSLDLAVPFFAADTYITVEDWSGAFCASADRSVTTNSTALGPLISNRSACDISESSDLSAVISSASSDCRPSHRPSLGGPTMARPQARQISTSSLSSAETMSPNERCGSTTYKSRRQRRRLCDSAYETKENSTESRSKRPASYPNAATVTPAVAGGTTTTTTTSTVPQIVEPVGEMR